jgi:hypothetical protein
VGVDAVHPLHPAMRRLVKVTLEQLKAYPNGVSSPIGMGRPGKYPQSETFFGQIAVQGRPRWAFLSLTVRAKKQALWKWLHRERPVVPKT